MGNIAQHCNLDDLKALRTVSRFFYAHTNQSWKRKAAVSVGHHRGWGRISMQEYLGRLKTSAGITISTFQNFTIEFSTLPSIYSTTGKLVRSVEAKFFESCGGQIKHLNLRHCKFNQETFLNTICRLAPALEELQVHTVQGCGGRGELDLDKFPVQTSLRSLHVAGGLPFDNWGFLKLFPNLKVAIIQSFFWSLAFQKL